MIQMHSCRNQFHYCLFLSLLAFLSGTLSGCRGTGKEPAGNPGNRNVPTVEALVARPQVLHDRIEVTGTLLANEEIELRSEISGRVEEILFREGTPVSKGSLLMKIDGRELQAQIRKLRYEEKQAGDDLYRKEKLLELKAVSREEYDISVNQLGIIRAQIDLLEVQLSRTELRAPFDGMIGLRQVSPGEYITPNVPVALLLQTDPIKLQFSIPEKIRNRIREGSRVDFLVTGSDSLYHAFIYALEPKKDPSTRTIWIRARCPNAAKYLTPGAFARVSIILGTIPDALIVPTEVVLPQLAGEKVFIYRHGIARLQPVESGIRSDREVQILRGLSPGDTVIVTGLLQLRDGMPVNVKFP